jgi:hypothetical protein
MKKQIVMLACLAVGACGSDSTTTPTTPAGPTTTDTPFVLTLTAGNEVPAITNAEAGASGTATIVFHVTRDAGGTVTNASVDFSVILDHFPAGSTARLSHIHTGAAGASGPVLVDTGLTPAAPVTMPAGTGTFSFTGVAVSPENAAAVLANPSGYYLNVHTVLNGGGAVRGQLK